jgi:hypothetical protein
MGGCPSKSKVEPVIASCPECHKKYDSSVVGMLGPSQRTTIPHIFVQCTWSPYQVPYYTVFSISSSFEVDLPYLVH